MQTSKAVCAVTFDLWDTLIINDSDEPKRHSLKLPTKREHRYKLLVSTIAKSNHADPHKIRDAFDYVESKFLNAWENEAVTWTARERLLRTLSFLQIKIPMTDLDLLVTAYQRMEVDIQPDPVDGAIDLLKRLAGDYRLGLISDTHITSGAGLREILNCLGMLNYFDALIFSDEIGRSKPHESMFRHACERLNVTPARAVHVGDREKKDVRGAKGFGMKTVLFAGARNDDRDHTSADYICEHLNRLPNLIKEGFEKQ